MENEVIKLSNGNVSYNNLVYYKLMYLPLYGLQYLYCCDNGRRNILDIKTNKMLLKDDVLNILSPKYGWIKYFENNKVNFINIKGKILYPNGFKTCSSFYKGFAYIALDNYAYNMINTKGKFVFDIWFDNIRPFSSEGNIYYAELNNTKYLLNPDKKEIYREYGI